MGQQDLEFGPIYLGLNLNMLLYGVMIMQTFEYYRHAQSDSKWIKRFVALLFLGDTINSGFDLTFGYIRFVSEFGGFVGIPTLTWYGNALPIAFITLTTTACQLFYAYRVRRLSNRRWLFWVIVVLATLQCAGGIGVGVASAIIRKIEQLYQLKVLAVIWVGFSILTDILITFALVWHLDRSKTGFQSTDDAISKIIRLTIQTGLLTTVWATLNLITYLCVRGNLYLFFAYPLSKIYTNSVMSSLNARYRSGPPESGNDSSNVYSTNATIKFRNARSSATDPTESLLVNSASVSAITFHRDSLQFAPSSLTVNHG